MPRSFLTKLSLLAFCAAASTALAGPTQVWTLDSYAQLQSGETTRGYVTSSGEIRPAWNTQRVALPGTGVWSAVAAPDGTIYAGTDDRAAIVRIAGDAVSTVVRLPDAMAVTGLAWRDGQLFASTVPGATIWKIDVRTGKASPFAKLDGTESVWTLAASRTGLVAGTGPASKLFSIDGAGKVTLLAAVSDKRITALHVARDGAIWFGTSERAIVYRWANGSARAMGDFAGNEISAITETARGIAVAANEVSEPTVAGTKTAAQLAATDKPNAAKGQAAKAPEVGSTPGADKDATAEPPRKNARKGKGAVFMIAANGDLTQVHALTQTYITDLSPGPDETLLVAAADKGRVYVVEQDDSVGTLFDFDERAVASLGWDGKRLWLATDDAAALYQTAGRATSALYVSEVFDAKANASLGRVMWHGQGALRLETRTGNTAQPDEGWSAWAPVREPGPRGATSFSGKSASPAGRYVQLRATLTESTASLRRMALHYAPANQPPRLAEVQAEPVSKERFVTLRDSTTKARNPQWRAKWKLDNGDDDETRYVVELQRERESTWRKISGPEPLTGTSWEWNTETYADAWYRIRVTASDAVANPAALAKTSTLTSAWFLVDNTKPSVAGITVRGATLEATATDASSHIAEFAYAIDDGPWQLGGAKDGIFDDNKEVVTGTLTTALIPGEHVLTVRVSDAAGNVASGSLPFRK